MPSKLTFAVYLYFLWSVAFAAQTPKYYLSLSGSKEGPIYHANITSLTNVIPILGFNFSATSPRDVATGLPAGRAQFTPVTVFKEMDTSSPLLMQVLTTNEIFQATITAVEEASNDNLATTFAWKLTNGGLSSVSYDVGTTMIEIIAMVFQKLEIDTTAGGKTVTAVVNTQAPFG
ncbi:hypothetical protein N431DRAFT_333734 [Stipitochalara longipes BDJ]|nr:hypothetical protein N431DRAFT_333734 [Stipitochalara longipes BDJ]